MKLVSYNLYSIQAKCDSDFNYRNILAKYVC